MTLQAGLRQEQYQDFPGIDHDLNEALFADWSQKLIDDRLTWHSYAEMMNTRSTRGNCGGRCRRQWHGAAGCSAGRYDAREQFAGVDDRRKCVFHRSFGEVAGRYFRQLAVQQQLGSETPRPALPVMSSGFRFR